MVWLMSCRLGMLLTTQQCQENQFTCDDGGCIPHIQRCDNVYDCRDFSDEQNCFNSGTINASLHVLSHTILIT